MSALACQLTGYDPLTKSGRCLGFDVNTGKFGYTETNGGLAGFATNMIAQMYVMPTHTSEYVRYLSSNFGIAKPVSAQGFGFESLSPLANLWATFRNLVYAVFVIIFMIIGIAIMFRVKIDPRTVMTIQNQLPRIIIGIILVTFSLAIAGLLIDLMYVVSYLVVGVFLQANNDLFGPVTLNIVGSTNPINALNFTANVSGGLGGISDLSSGASTAIGGHLGDLFDNPMGSTIVGIITGAIGMIVGGTIGNISVFGTGGPGIGALLGAVIGGIFGAAAADEIAGAVISMIAFLVIAVAVIASLFRLWFQLILAYINILIDIVFAPFWIAAGLIPGSKINFSSWVRNLAANLAAFPAVITMFLLARMFVDEFKGEPTSAFVPPLIGDPGTTNQIGAIIALGIVLATPSVVKLMKQVFGAPQAGFGPVFESLSTGFGIVATPTRRITGSLFGKNPYTGAPRAGSRIFGDMLRRTTKNATAGAWGQLLTGGGRRGAGPLIPQRIRNWRGRANPPAPAAQNLPGTPVGRAMAQRGRGQNPPGGQTGGQGGTPPPNP